MESQFRIFYKINKEPHEMTMIANSELEVLRKFMAVNEDASVYDIRKPSDIENEEAFKAFKEKYSYLYEYEENQYNKKVSYIKANERDSPKYKTLTLSLARAKESYEKEITYIDNKIKQLTELKDYPETDDIYSSQDLQKQGQNCIAIIDLTDKNNQNEIIRIYKHERKAV